MKKARHIGRAQCTGQRWERRLHPALDLPRQKVRCDLEARQGAFGRRLVARGGRTAEVDHTLRLGIVEKGPRRGDGGTVDGVVGPFCHRGRRPEDNALCRCAGGAQFAQAVEAPEALAERVERGALGHQCVEVVVGARFDALGRYHDQGGDVVPAATAGADPAGELAHQGVAFERPHTSRQQHGLGTPGQGCLGPRHGLQ